MLEVNPAMPAPNHAALSSVNNLFAAALQTTVKHNNVRGEVYCMELYPTQGPTMQARSRMVISVNVDHQAAAQPLPVDAHWVFVLSQQSRQTVGPDNL